MVVCILYVLKSCQFNACTLCIRPPPLQTCSILCHILVSQSLYYVSSMEGSFINFVLLQLLAVSRWFILETKNRQETLTN
jgi:hypothetical protein